MPSTASPLHHISRSSRGWKVLGPNGRTVARFEGHFAHRRAERFVREGARGSAQAAD
jgi:hypothetical protein